MFCCLLLKMIWLNLRLCWNLIVLLSRLVVEFISVNVVPLGVLSRDIPLKYSLL